MKKDCQRQKQQQTEENKVDAKTNDHICQEGKPKPSKRKGSWRTFQIISGNWKTRQEVVLQQHL